MSKINIGYKFVCVCVCLELTPTQKIRQNHQNTGIYLFVGVSSFKNNFILIQEF